MVDAVVSLFLEKLVAAIQRGGEVILHFDDEFKRMERNLKYLQGFLWDLDRKQRKNNTIFQIASELRDLIYEAEDILACCSSSGLAEPNSGVRGFLENFSPTKITTQRGIWKRLNMINDKIEQIEKKITSFLHAAVLINRWESNNDRSWSAPIFDESLVVGLECDLHKIKSWLFQGSEDLTIVGFVGMGGLGKTTIAQMVFNDKEICDRFEKRMWVSVSQRVDEEKIMRSILKHLGDIGIDDGKAEMLKKINAYLFGKSYLLVLDDVWTLRDGWWERLKAGLPKGNKCYVVMTTRIEDHARRMGATEDRIHRPTLLSDADSWTLFSKIAFYRRREMSQDPELNDIGRKIMRKCGGLPLAIKAVGGMMASKSTSIPEWTRITENFSEELARSDGLVKASLQLSYDELPTRLKPCLLSFSIYPEDCVILGDQLTRWWIGEGFVPLKNGKYSVESAEDQLMELVNRCLVEVVEKGHDGKVYTCKIHDLVRDLVINIGDNEGFVRLGDPQSRRMPINDGIGESNLYESSTRRRAVVSVTNCRYVERLEPRLLEKICGCENLRVLDLSESISEAYFDDMLSRIGSLRQLRYVNLRNAHPMVELPISMADLRDLLVLDLSFCHSLVSLPSCITTMTKLVVLDLSCCGSLMHLPKGLGKLSHLQVLKGFKPSSSRFPLDCRMGELRSLTQLVVLEMVVTQADQIVDKDLDALLPLSRLRSLSMNCFNCQGPERLAKKLERLSLPGQINALTLKYYPGGVTPQWLNPRSLSRLQYLSICSGDFTCFSQGFYGGETPAWRVVGLLLELLPDLEYNWQNLQKAMPHLREVNVSWCPKLAEFPIENTEFEGGVWKSRQEDGSPY